MKKLQAVLTVIVVSIALSSTALAVRPGTPLDGQIHVVAPGWSAEVIYEPGPLAGAHGLEFGPDGLLYLAAGDWSGVRVVDVRKGQVKLLPPLLEPQKISSFADDLSIDNAGNIYLTNNTADGEVFKISPDGRITVLAILSGPNPVHYDRVARRLYVGEAFLGSGRLLELDASRFNSSPRVIFDAVKAFHAGVDINGFVSRPKDRNRPDKERKLIVPVPFAKDDGGVILEIDPDTGQSRELLWTSDFHFPIAVDVGPDNLIYYLDYLTGDVLRFGTDQSPPRTERLGSVGRAGDNLAFAPDGRLFVTNSVTSNIYEVPLSGGETRPLFRNGGHVWTSIAVIKKNIHLANWMGLFQLKGGDLVPLDKTFGFFEKLPISWSVADGPKGHVLYTDYQTGSVIEMDPDTGTRTPIGPGKSSGRPLGVHFVASTGKVYVAEWASGQIIEYDAGDPTQKRVLATLEKPVDLVAVGRKLYVAEIGPAKITQIDIDTGMKMVLLSKYIGRPKGIDADAKGNLVVADTALRQIYRIDPATRNIEVLVEDITLNNQNSEYETRSPQGIETLSPVYVTEDGSILITDFNGRLFRLKHT